MNQCVPSWDFDEPPKADMLALHSNPTLDEMAELIWENGQLVMHDLCPPRVVAKGKQTTTEHSWNKPRESGTLESIVNQATQFTPPSQSSKFRDGDDLGSRFNNHRNHHCATVPTSSNTMAMGALVEEGFVRKRARVGMTGEEGSMNNYHSVMESNTNANTLDDSVSHSITQREVGGEDDHKNKKGNNERSTVSTKRSRAAAIHNQSEGKRRNKINQRMKTLQKLVPNSSKTDKASILDEVIDYLKQLQAQVQMMSRMSMPQMMMPMAMSQQFQMAMMAQMSMGTVMGMGMGMDMNTVGQPNISGIPLVFNPAAAFMPISSWDGTSDHVPSSVTTPMANFLACQSQPMNIDAYSRMAALYQQLHRRQVSNPRPET